MESSLVVSAGSGAGWDFHILDIHTLGVFLCIFQSGIPELGLTQPMWMPGTQLLCSLVPLTKERSLSHLFLLNGPFQFEAFVRF